MKLLIFCSIFFAAHVFASTLPTTCRLVMTTPGAGFSKDFELVKINKTNKVEFITSEDQLEGRNASVRIVMPTTGRSKSDMVNITLHRDYRRQNSGTVTASAHVSRDLTLSGKAMITVSSYPTFYTVHCQ